MKNTLLFTVAGALAIGGITFAALHNWSGTESQVEIEGLNSTSNVSQNQNSNSNEVVNTTSSSYAIAFYIDEKPFRVEMNGGNFTEPVPIADEQSVELVEMEKYFTTSLMPGNVFKAMPITEGMIFFSGLQSNTNPDLWFYTERDMDNMNFNVRMYNAATKEGKLFFGQSDSPNKDYAFQPFAVSADNSKLYLQALIFGNFTEQEEVWVMDLNTQKIEEINVHEFYVSTPAMSPDGKYLLYTAASETNDVHVPANQLFVYDLENKKEIRIMGDAKAFVSMRGWIKGR